MHRHMGNAIQYRQSHHQKTKQTQGHRGQQYTATHCGDGSITQQDPDDGDHDHTGPAGG